MRRLEHLRLILEINILTNYITLLSIKRKVYINFEILLQLQEILSINLKVKSNTNKINLIL